MEGRRRRHLRCLAEAGVAARGGRLRRRSLGAGPGFCRQVPDISLDADPNTGYIIYCTAGPCHNGGWGQIGGTSAGAPLMAGITADMNEYSLANGGQRLGFANPFLYGAPAGHFYDVTLGDNDDAGTLGAVLGARWIRHGLGAGIGRRGRAGGRPRRVNGTPPAAVGTTTTAVQDKGKILVGQTVNLHGTAKERDGTLLPAESVVWLEFRVRRQPVHLLLQEHPAGRLRRVDGDPQAVEADAVARALHGRRRTRGQHIGMALRVRDAEAVGRVVA